MNGYRQSVSKPFRGPLIALIAVVLMMAVPFTFIGSDEVSADPSDYYRYEMSYNEAGILISEIRIFSSPDDREGTVATKATPTDDGSWGFDRKTGYGPFNSYYAAVSTADGKVAYHLDPYDLSKKIDGTPADITSGLYNILWILPTVYVSSTSTKLTLCSDDSCAI